MIAVTVMVVVVFTFSDCFFPFVFLLLFSLASFSAECRGLVLIFHVCLSFVSLLSNILYSSIDISHFFIELQSYRGAFASLCVILYSIICVSQLLMKKSLRKRKEKE